MSWSTLVIGRIAFGRSACGHSSFGHTAFGTPPLGGLPSCILPLIFLGACLPTRGARSASTARHFGCVRQAFSSRLPTRGEGSASLAFGPSAFGSSAFGPTAFGLTAFGHTAFDRVRHAFGARLYPLTLVWCVTWPPRSPLPTPTQRRGVDLGGAYTVLATEPVLEASTWFASTPYPACLWRTWALTFMVLSRHTWWASWEGRKLGAATPSWPSRVALRRVSPRGNPPASTPRVCKTHVFYSPTHGNYLLWFQKPVQALPPRDASRPCAMSSLSFALRLV